MKELWRDYWSRWNKENVKNAFRTLVNAVIMVPFWFCFFIGHELHENVFVGTILIPLLFFILLYEAVLFSSAIHPLRLDNINYLCPMTQEERRKMLIRNHLFSSGMHMVLFAGFDIMFVMLRGFQFLPFGIMVYHQVIASLLPISGEVSQERSFFQKVKLFSFVMAFALLAIQIALYNSMEFAWVGEALLIMSVPIWGAVMWNVWKEILVAK